MFVKVKTRGSYLTNLGLSENAISNVLMAISYKDKAKNISKCVRHSMCSIALNFYAFNSALTASNSSIISLAGFSVTRETTILTINARRNAGRSS